MQKTVTQPKWDKARKYVAELNVLKQRRDGENLNYKWLEQIRGFFCHLAMTYDLLFPFLKGFHLTLASFLPQRDKYGWKVPDALWTAYLTSKQVTQTTFTSKETVQGTYITPPKSIQPVPRFWTDLEVLTDFFEVANPPLVTVRSKKMAFVFHGFVDASKSGFGSTISYGRSIKYRIGTWGKDLECESSNWREFTNLVETIEEDARQGLLQDCVLFMCTDNSTVEHCMYKGNSKSPKLHNLIVRLRQCEFRYGFRLYLTHVSGERMKAQGTDGISRGSLREGVSLGDLMHSYCPWGESCLDRSPIIEDWIRSWVPNSEFLTPNQWFERGHDHSGGYRDQQGFWRIKERPGHLVWTPPPAAADAMLEELRKARIKRHVSTHYVLIPTLFTHLWKRQLLKACDVVITIPPIHDFWSRTQFESLTLGICFPFLPCPPFQFCSTPKMFRMARELHQMFKSIDMEQGHFLRKFLLECKRISSMPPSVVWKVLFYTSSPPFSHRSSGGRRKRKRVEPDETEASLGI